ncbi:MAG: alpha/beta fold hydrolase, partial [Pseudomonadota bacterium]
SGQGNFQFKNKYRTENLPVYLCHPTDTSAADVSAVLLLICNPTVADNESSVDAIEPSVDHGSLDLEKHRQSKAAVGAFPTVDDPLRQQRREQLASVGWDALALPRAAGATDMITDSWAEREDPWIEEHLRDLADTGEAIVYDLNEQDTLPFSYVQAAPSGKAAEATLLRAIGPKRSIIQNNLFPSWTFNSLDLGFKPHVLRLNSLNKNQVEIDLAHLDELIQTCGNDLAMCCIELSPNAYGGKPISLEHIRQLHARVDAAGVPLVFDATRGFDNAQMIASETGQGVWQVMNELFSCATAITLSMPKDFGVTFGGLIATSDPGIIAGLKGRIRDRGQEVGLAERRQLATALADKHWLETAVAARVAHTQELAAHLKTLGVPVHSHGSHAILIDAQALCKDYQHPLASTLAWLYEVAELRAAPHLSSGFQYTQHCVRLAVPAGLTDTDLATLKDSFSQGLAQKIPPLNLLKVEATKTSAAFYQPSEDLPEDVIAAINEGIKVLPQDANWAELKSWQPQIRRSLVPHDDGHIEVFDIGEGHPLVFLHPFNVGLGFFAPQMRDLASDFHVIGIHAPGVGATDAASDLTFKGLSRLVRAGVRGIGEQQKFTVVGASFGGLTAISTAHKYTDDIASLILLGSSYKVGNRKGEVNRLSVVAGEDFDALAAVQAQLSAPREELQALLQRCESIDPKIGLRFLDVFSSKPNLLEIAAEIHVPSLVIHGEQDTVINIAIGRQVQETIPGSHYIELDDAGHFPSLTASERVNAAIKQFIQENQKP